MGESTRVWIRSVTWILMVVTVAFLIVLALERSHALRPAVVRLGKEAGSSQAVGVSEGFQFIENVEGRTLFTVDAERTLGLRSGWTRIEHVRFRWFGRNDLQLEVSCDHARFNPQTRDLQLRGSVHIGLAGGGFLDTARGSFDASTQSFRSETHVVFSNGDIMGEASNVTYNLASTKLTLGGGVVVRERDGQFLRAPEIRYNRKSGRAVFPRGLEITGSSMVVTAPRAVVTTDETGKGLRKIELTGGVRARSGELEDGSVFSFRAERVRAVRNDEERWQIQATTTGPWVQLEVTGGEDFELRRLQTWRLRGVIGEEGPIKAVFEQQVCVEDVPRYASPRWASARRGQLWFEHGAPAGFAMERDVWLRSEGYTVTADSARFLGGDQKVVFGSDPDQRHRATVLAGGLQVSARHVEGFQTDGIVRAEGEVQGVVKEGLLLGHGGGAAPGGPIRFACDRLEVREKGRDAILKGAARVWQGDRLLLADEITMHQGGDRLEASGNVRMTAAATQFNPDAPKDREALIVAQSLVYDRTAGVIEIKGNVRYSDPLYLMSCSVLVAKLGEQNRAETIDASGAVDIQDLAEGRHMQGEKAHYTAKTHLLEMSGKPVRLLDSKKNLITGTSLTWNRTAGTVSVSGGEDAPTETIYHTGEIH